MDFFSTSWRVCVFLTINPQAVNLSPYCSPTCTFKTHQTPIHMTAFQSAIYLPLLMLWLIPPSLAFCGDESTCRETILLSDSCYTITLFPEALMYNHILFNIAFLLNRTIYIIHFLLFLFSWWGGTPLVLMYSEIRSEMSESEYGFKLLVCFLSDSMRNLLGIVQT